MASRERNGIIKAFIRATTAEQRPTETQKPTLSHAFLLTDNVFLRAIENFAESHFPNKVVFAYEAASNLLHDTRFFDLSEVTARARAELDQWRQRHTTRYIEAAALSKVFKGSLRAEEAIGIAAFFDQAVGTFQPDARTIKERVTSLTRLRIDFHDFFESPVGLQRLGTLLRQLARAPQVNEPIKRHLFDTLERERVRVMKATEMRISSVDQGVFEMHLAADDRAMLDVLGADRIETSQLVRRYFENVRPDLAKKVNHFTAAYFIPVIAKLLGNDSGAIFYKFEELNITPEVALASIVHSFGRNCHYPGPGMKNLIPTCLKLNLFSSKDLLKVANLIEAELIRKIKGVPGDLGIRINGEEVVLAINIPDMQALRCALELARDLGISMEPYGRYLIHLYIRQSQKPLDGDIMSWLDELRSIALEYGIDQRELNDITRRLYLPALAPRKFINPQILQTLSR